MEDKTTFQPSYQNKSCSECQQDVRKIDRQADGQTDRQTERQMDRQTDDRQMTDRQTFQLSYQNKSILECQKDVKASVRQTGRYTERWADSVTERQNDSMADSRAAKEPALVNLENEPSGCLQAWYPEQELRQNKGLCMGA